jgi:two-component system, OmpR family, sensor histidine kinase MtrB
MHHGSPTCNTEPVPRRRTLRLRTRVTLFFAFIALLAGVVLIGVTYGLTRNNLLDEDQNAARQQALGNADLVRQQLTVDPNSIGVFFDDELRTDPNGFAVLSSGDPAAPRASTSVLHPITDFPERLVDSVRDGTSALQNADIDGSSYVTVGVYIAEYDTGYFEAFPLAGTESTLTAILTALLLGALGTVVLATLFGLATSRRLLRPLSQVADAAADIASGGLDTRLATESDPDLDRLAGSFNDMADAVQARIEREARFASDVSHELRSPITALTAAVEVLDGRRDDIPERTQQALDVVVDQVRRFDSMVIDLLELARIDAGATDLNVEDVSLVDLTRRVAARFGEPDVPIVAVNGLPRRAALDKVRFERILGNLLENARNHGGGPVRIELAAAAPGRFRLAVEDGGPGVAQGERDRIFERFARGSAARHRIGTGLGLALVREHTAAMGGTAWVQDRIGGGARFVVELPERVSTARWGIEMTARTWRTLAVAAAVAVVSSCGVPMGDDSFSVIAPEEDPFDLDETSTTTSTTTTPPTTTLPVTPDTVAPTTTIVRLEPAEFYFLTPRGRLQPVVVDLPPPFAADQIADILEDGPPPDVALESLVADGLIVGSSESRSVLTVDLDADTFARIPSSQQTEAIGQIVMTMITSLRRVGLVNFTIDDEPISVKKGNSLLSDVGEPLSYDDYVILLASPPPAVASTTQTIRYGRRLHGVAGNDNRRMIAVSNPDVPLDPAGAASPCRPSPSIRDRRPREVGPAHARPPA